MRHTRADARPRIWISPNRDRQTVNWSRHPAGTPSFAATPGAALDAALSAIGHVPEVIIFGQTFAGQGEPDP